MPTLNYYPSRETIANASHLTICKWYRFLQSPKNEEEIELLDLIIERFKKGGGMTPAISKQIGLD